MDEKEIAVKLTAHDHEIKSSKHRLDKLEKVTDSIYDLSSSVNKLAINIEHLIKEQAEHNERLRKLESEPLENAKYYKRLIISTIITTALGVILGLLFANIK